MAQAQLWELARALVQVQGRGRVQVRGPVQGQQSLGGECLPQWRTQALATVRRRMGWSQQLASGWAPHHAQRMLGSQMHLLGSATHTHTNKRDTHHISTMHTECSAWRPRPTWTSCTPHPPPLCPKQKKQANAHRQIQTGTDPSSSP